MADNNKQIKSDEQSSPATQGKSEESVDQKVGEPAESVDQPTSKPEESEAGKSSEDTESPENRNTDQADSAENTDTPTSADTPNSDVAQSANIAQDDDTPPQDEVSEPIPEPEVEEEAAEEVSSVISSDSEKSPDSESEIASPTARNDEKGSADPSATPQDDKLEPEEQEKDEVADNTDTPTEADTAETPEDGSPDLAEPPVLADTTDNPNAKWYVVHTFSGHENKVATNLKQRIESEHLENRIVDILVPTQDKIEIRGGKKEQVKEKIFPGYILVKMDLDDAGWLAVRTTQGVTAFVGMNNKPTPISEREVSSIVKFMTQGAPATFKDVFMINDTVKIVDGPFTDFIGKVESVDKEKGKVRVLVSIFGRETPVELDFLQVTKL